MPLNQLQQQTLKLSCGNCGYVMLFDAEMLGIRGLWDFTARA